MDLAERLSRAQGNRYTIERKLGQGGASVVFLATDAKLGRRVAIKVLRPELAATLAADRFLREIRIAASLAHSHIIALYDSGEADGLLYFAMPYVEGESLRQRLDREGALPIGEAIRLTLECCDALAHAHAHGIIHRDIKPENILLQAGHALVSDFGIAHALSAAASDRITSGDVAIGTPAYMSPEQAAARPGLDARSDIYSLGCVLYEMLAGEPPFTGRSAQAVISHHLVDPPPSLRVLRPTAPSALQLILETALAKVPADRFASAAVFADALRGVEMGGVTGGQTRPAGGRRAPWWRIPVAAAVIGVLALLVRYVIFPPGPNLDANRVVGFPLHATDAALRASEVGLDVALAIGAAFEHAAPLRWIDGWTRLEEAERADPGALAPRRAREIARDRGARYYMDGVITRRGDSVAVVLRLHDAGADTVVAQETVGGGTGETGLAVLGLGALVRILPHLVEPSRAAVDLSPLTDRHPGAIALAMQGDREYRRSQFGTALEFYHRALREDSLFAYAAVRGAQAANWTESGGLAEAETLIGLALANDMLLPPRHRAFARGLGAYLAGRADEAVREFRAALADDDEWVEAWTALGEVHYHLMPAAGNPDSVMWASFRTAASLDTGFTPPLFHLTEAAAIEGDIEGAARMLARLRARGSDTLLLQELGILVDCTRLGADAFDWSTAVRTHPGPALGAAKSLSVGAKQLACAERGFRAILDYDSASAGERWGALLGHTGLLLAQGRDEEARAAIDDAIAGGLRGAYSLYLLGDLAGGAFGERAAEAEGLARAGAGERYEGVGDPFRRLLLGAWDAGRGDAGRLRAVAALQRERAIEGAAGEALAADALDAWVMLADGDTSAAIARLSALRPVSPRIQLTWGLTEPLAAERALLAELLLRVGRYEEADRVAASFDHTGPIINLPFLPAALAVRRAAAAARNRPDLERRHGERLAALGWDATSPLEHRRP